MIRSPPPTSWPRSPHFSAFNYSQENGLTISSQSSDESSSGILSIRMPKLSDMFSPHRSHSQISEGSAKRSSIKNKNNILIKDAGIPRPHSSHHRFVIVIFFLSWILIKI